MRKLKILRECLGLTQEAFAERINLSYKYYQKLELGLRKDLRSSTLDKIAEAVGLETWQLLDPDLLPGSVDWKYAMGQEQKLQVAEGDGEESGDKKSGRKGRRSRKEKS